MDSVMTDKATVPHEEEEDSQPGALKRHRRQRGAAMGSSRNGKSARSSTAQAGGKRVALNAEEVSALLAACRRYRHTIPVYLASRKAELNLLDAVIRKLR